MPDNAWDLVFKPEYISKLKSCGVSFLDSATEVVPAALHYLGKPSFSKTPGDYAAAASLLKKVRPHVTLFSSSGYINDMANGSICVALGWSGDINIARQRAIDGKTGHNIEALIPKTGGLLFFDVMVIPADARARATRTSSSTTSCARGARQPDQQGLLRQPEHRVASPSSSPRWPATRRCSCRRPTWPRWCRPTRSTTTCGA
jgi:hypothetical protein